MINKCKKFLAYLILALGVINTGNTVYAEAEQKVGIFEESEIIEAAKDQPEFIMMDDIQSMSVEPSDDSKKIVSVLGDSIATFQYYSYWGNYCDYYTEEHMSVHDTWWMHYIDTYDMQLGVNDSLGSSRVAWDEKEYPIPSYLGPDKAMASDKRIQNLAANGVPDVILFFGGSNDLGVTELGEFQPENPSMEIRTFADAYQTAILKMKQYYPQAQIVAVTPYYWPTLEKQIVDEYCDMILQICEYYDIPCTDLRKAGLRFPQDMFGPGYDHPNEYGMTKMWHLIEKGRPQFTTNGIYVPQNNANGIEAGMTLSTPEAYDSVVYQWFAVDADTGEQVLETEKSNSNWLSWTPTYSGTYNLRCVAQNTYGETTEYIQKIEYQEAGTDERIRYNGITWISQEDYLDVGVSYSTEDEQPEFMWMSYNVSTGQWKIIQNWSNQNWTSWKEEPGTYWLYVKGRTKDRKSYFENTTAFAYYPGNAEITGTYAGWLDSEKVLLGCVSNVQKAKYEFKIYNLDTKQWFWGSGRMDSWTTWEAEEGNYWLHFECYSEDGRRLDTRTYCFAVH